MKQGLIILYIVICSGCYTSKNTTIDYNEIISEKYSSHDSLLIEITYNHIPSCIESYSSNLVISIAKNTSMVSSRMYDKNLETIGPIPENIIQDIILFEKEAKTDKTSCGGYVGGNGISVTMKINNEVTKFSYCRDNWDGIRELLSRIRERETKLKE